MASRYASAVPSRTGPTDTTIPDPPAVCGCEGCNEAPFWIAAFCRVGSAMVLGSLSLARKRKGTEKGADQFSRRTKGGAWATTSDFAFVRWLARCERCYIAENGL